MLLEVKVKMPKYTYHCLGCKSTYTMVHSLSEVHDVCTSCGVEKNLNKIPVTFNYNKVKKKKSQDGALLRDTIEESKQEIEEVKQELKRRKHEP
jgi:DNA replicative helicase MCM subunit Mcm2 (Cdc46/Mcm family)